MGEIEYLSNVNSPKDLKKLNIPALTQLSDEIREFLIDTVSQTGGHLASNLGVVELTVALHYCFSSPRDKIVWDVGHQAYVHKILTGRKGLFDTLRMQEGLSGFPKHEESIHDIMDSGHSSTSISVGLGLAAARDLKKKDYHVISVIGDGAMTGGLAFEGLNCAGRLKSNFIVILNDNQMSISENVGAISNHLNNLRTAPSYLEVKEDVNNLLNKIPYLGRPAGRAIEKTKDSLRNLLVPGALFEEFGFNYVGPVNGHNIEDLIKVLNRVKRVKGPVLLHVYTKKGKGFFYAEKYPETYHGIGPFDRSTGQLKETKIWDTYSDVFGRTIKNIGDKNKRVVAITAAMPSGTGLKEFAKAFPDRTFDVGIAEGHAVTFASGMARSGFIPVFAVYSTFLQRAYDQILHDVCIQNLHVIFAIDRAGIVGSDGETHQGMYDIAFLSHIPNMTVMSPKNKNELKEMLNFAVEFNGPIALRYPRAAASNALNIHRCPIVWGKSEIINKGEKAVIIALGEMTETGALVYERLKQDGFNPGFINARFAKPLDIEMIESLRNYEYVFIAEDGCGAGGLASLILSEMSERKIESKVYSFAFPDEFIPQATRQQLFTKYGMDAEHIYSRISEILNE